MPSPPQAREPAPETGPQVIRAALRSLPSTPGVYRMLDSKGNALYVGKAKNLKKRVTSYGGARSLGARIGYQPGDPGLVGFAQSLGYQLQSQPG